jgi:hypothetical protein
MSIFYLLLRNAPFASLIAVAPKEYKPTVIEPSAVDSERNWKLLDSYHVYESGLTIIIEPSSDPAGAEKSA